MKGHNKGDCSKCSKFHKCGFEKGNIPWNKGLTISTDERVKKEHINRSKESYITRGMLGKKHSIETKRKMSKIHKGKTLTSEHKMLLSKLFTGRFVSNETRKRMGKASKGRNQPKRAELNRARKGIFKHNNETKKKLSEIFRGLNNPMYGKSHTLAAREKIRKARHNQIFPKFRTKPELKFIELCLKYNLPYKYTGDGTFWIENINPDFVNVNGEKICVEIWGDYWHNLPGTIEKDKLKLKTLKVFGWKRIIIWEHELKELSDESVIRKFD